MTTNVTLSREDDEGSRTTTDRISRSFASLRMTGLVLALTVPVFARVLSHAPYTSRVATPGYHERTTRHFLLLERTGSDSIHATPSSQVVLYDASGIDEPRVIYPQSGSGETVMFAALYEPKTIASPLAHSWILIGLESKLLFSTNNGATWKDVEGLQRTVSPIPEEPTDVDVGGPFTRGLASQVQLGTDQYPFVVACDRSVVRIDANGSAQTMIETPGERPTLVGRNAAGNRFLVRSDDTIRILNSSGGGWITLIAETDPHAQYSGWIVDYDAAYIQALRPEGRFLFFVEAGFPMQFIQGPYGTPYPRPATPVHYADTNRFFAVPTHDFNGAWMIRRDSYEPTTLSRHTIARGVESMWSDTTRAQVEALIAGASGETLLVQAHHERRVGLDQPFLDPTIAVWRVGERAPYDPNDYHELALNESWSKGFVHVDVDGLESGKPFVFNAGLHEATNIIMCPPLPTFEVTQVWGVVRASLRQHLVFPGVARLRGAFDSNWLTDVTLVNLQPGEQNVEIRYIALGEAPTALGTESKTITLQSYEVRVISDVLKSLFDLDSGGGALHFFPESRVHVGGRTYTRNAQGGTLGFNMEAIDVQSAASARLPMTFAGAFPGEHFRTNMLLTDTSGRGSSAALHAFGLTGAIGANNVEIAAPAGGVAQANGIGGPLGLFANEAGGLRVTPSRGTVIPTVVAIDNRSNDPTWFPPDVSGSVPRMIPVIGHLDGANGARFRSDLYLLNPHNEPRTMVLEAKSWDSAAGQSVQLTLEPNEARVIPDVLSTTFGMTGLARLRFETWGFGEGIRATSRTYTVEESGATYGCLIPPLTHTQIAAPDDRLEIFGVTAGPGFRVNLGLVELTRGASTGDVEVQVMILDTTGKPIDIFTVAVPKAGGRQINNLFAARGITPPDSAVIIVQNIDRPSEGLISAYVTLTDNQTNDPTFLGAQLP